MEKINQEVSLGGVVTTHYTDELTNKLITRTEQDISAAIQMATAMRNDDDYWRQGVKKSFAHAAHIPASVVVELLGIGVNVYHASAKDIVAGIKRIGKDHLLTTRKQV